MRVVYGKKFLLEHYGGPKFETEYFELSDEVDTKDVDKTFHKLKMKVHSQFAQSLQLDKIALESVKEMQERIKKEANLEALEK